MDYVVEKVKDEEREELAELRVVAMRESLEAIGRFDPERARSRFLESFSLPDTKKVTLAGELIGFYTLREAPDHISLDHLYVAPAHQSQGLGSRIIEEAKRVAAATRKPLRLNALRHSRSNLFYKRHELEQTHEAEWDIYYEWLPLP
jgi:GNAT superfamily N-acetyltransferase